jgi:hypothetical protein
LEIQFIDSSQDGNIGLLIRTGSLFLFTFDVCRGKKRKLDSVPALIITAEVTAANGIFPSTAKKKMKEQFYAAGKIEQKISYWSALVGCAQE